MNPITTHTQRTDWADGESRVLLDRVEEALVAATCDDIDRARIEQLVVEARELEQLTAIACRAAALEDDTPLTALAADSLALALDSVDELRAIANTAELLAPQQCLFPVRRAGGAS